MLVSIDSKGAKFRERVLLLRTLRNVVSRQIEFWDCINRLERLVDMASDTQLWIERTSAVVNSGNELTLVDVDDYLATGLIHVVSQGQGGLSTASHRTYVFRQCPFIKIDVKFTVSSHGEELPTDKIAEVSRPYLAWSVMD